jgi:transcriptional regulator with XRE-family HTH domain
MSQEELAAAVGTDPRNIRRWEAEGHDPAGTVLLRVLSAVGVRVEPAPHLPGPVNTELRSLVAQLDSERDLAASRQEELRDRLAELESQLRILTTRLEELGSQRG